MIEFSKYHGCGNTFIIIEEQKNIDYASLAKRLCEPHIGIGADGLLVLKHHPLSMLIYNADGSEASMCGNGIRCLGEYMLHHHYLKSRKLSFKTKAGKIDLKILNAFPFLGCVRMGKPFFKKDKVGLASSYEIPIKIAIDRVCYEVYTVFMGTIHSVIFLDSLSFTNIEQTDIAERISKHPLFREQCNVNFAHIISENEVVIKTYEKGVGWTLACGSGCCSVYVIGRLFRGLGMFIKAITKGGSLIVYSYQIPQTKDNWQKDVYLVGPSMEICSGSVE